MKSEGLSSEKEKNEWMKMFNHLRFLSKLLDRHRILLKIGKFSCKRMLRMPTALTLISSERYF